MTPQFGDPISENTVGVIAIISIFVAFPIALALARLIWKRGSQPEVKRVSDPDVARKLTELQTSMDAMALEIERISEGQRFVTKLMSEMPAGSLPSGDKEGGRRKAEGGRK